MTIILFQRGATSLGFQFGKLEISFLYPRYWRTSGLCRIHWWK